MAEGQNPKRQSLEDIVNQSSQGGGGTPPAGEDRAPKSGSKPENDDDRGGRPANGLIIAGLITGGLSIVGVLIPILGILLGIAALVLGRLARKRSKDRRAVAAMALGGLGVVLSVVVIAVVASGAGGDENADAMVSCLKDDANLGDVKSRKTSKAEDIDALKDAAKNADEFVSATDAEGRDVYVLLFKSKKRAERARDDVSGDREVGVREKNLVIYSNEIGPENRTKLEGCFL